MHDCGVGVSISKPAASPHPSFAGTHLRTYCGRWMLSFITTRAPPPSCRVASLLATCAIHDKPRGAV